MPAFKDMPDVQFFWEFFVSCNVNCDEREGERGGDLSIDRINYTFTSEVITFLQEVASTSTT